MGTAATAGETTVKENEMSETPKTLADGGVLARAVDLGRAVDVVDALMWFAETPDSASIEAAVESTLQFANRRLSAARQLTYGHVTLAADVRNGWGYWEAAGQGNERNCTIADRINERSDCVLGLTGEKVRALMWALASEPDLAADFRVEVDATVKSIEEARAS